eukprot:735311_1
MDIPRSPLSLSPSPMTVPLPRSDALLDLSMNKDTKMMPTEMPLIHEEKSDHANSMTISIDHDAIVDEKYDQPSPLSPQGSTLIKPSQYEETIGVSDVEIVNNMSCCLSFLLHQDSPLWTSSSDIDFDDATDSSALPQSSPLLTKKSQSIHLSVLKQIKQGKGFQKRCAKWQSDHNITLKNLPGAENAERALSALSMMDGRDARWPRLMKFWCSWYKYINMDADYTVDLDWIAKDIDPIDRTVDVLLGKAELVDLSDDSWSRRVSKWKAFENPLSLLETSSSPRYTGTVEFKNEEDCRDRISVLWRDARLLELSDIDDKMALRTWLKRYKVKAMLRQQVIEENVAHFTDLKTYCRGIGDKMKSCFSGVTREIRSFLGEIGSEIRASIIGETFEDDDSQLCIEITQLPLRHWTWKHVVYYVERIHECKEFAGIFHEWRINGDELLVMNAQHIKLLIQCCKGYPENKDVEKLLDDDDLIDELIIQIKKCFIVSTITFQYDLYWKVLQNIKDNKLHPLCDHASNIIDIIHFLRPKYSQGPKALWKLQDALYFSKIDNILCILVICGKYKKLFQDCYPRFIFDDKQQHSYHETRFDLTVLRTARAPSMLSLATTEKHFGNTLVLDVYDVLDETATDDKRCYDVIYDTCCSNPRCRSCVRYLREFDRVYCNVIVLLCVCLSVGSLITYSWMSNRAHSEINTAVSWATQAIVDRAKQQMEYEFFIPQMILNIAVNGLFSDDISINASQYSDGLYDRFFMQFTQYKASKSEVHSLFMYTSDSLIGGFMNNGTDPMIHVFDGHTQCMTQYSYDEALGTRDGITSRECGTFDPTSRPWYVLAAQNENGYIGWTAPYKFHSTLQGYGITLIHKTIHNNAEILFLCDFTLHSIKHMLSSISELQGSILYVMNTHGTVLSSDIDESDLHRDDCDYYYECDTEHPFIVESAERIRLSGYLDDIVSSNVSIKLRTDVFSDEYSVTLYSVELLHGHANEHGMIVLLYDKIHLEEIDVLQTLAALLYLSSMCAAVLVICLMGRRLQWIQDQIKQRKSLHQGIIRRPQERQHFTVPSDSLYLDLDPADLDDEFEDNLQRRMTRITFKVTNSCICEHKTILLCSFWYSFLVFMAMYALWITVVTNIAGSILDVFYAEEYLIVHDTVTSVLNITESIADVVEERFSWAQTVDALQYDEFLPSTDIFLTHLMNTVTYANGDEYDYAYSIAIGTPDGKYIAARQDKNEVKLTVRDGSTNWITNEYIVDPITSQRSDQIMATSSNYDPRCEFWYNQTLSFMFDGNIEDAFGGMDNLNDFYFPLSDKISTELIQDCIDLKKHYLDIWDVDEDELIHSNDTASSLATNKIYTQNVQSATSYNCKLEEQIDVPLAKYNVIWSKYSSASLTASKPIIDATSGQIIGILSIDLTLKGLSDALNQTNNYITGENDWISWIFADTPATHYEDETGETEQYDMIASSEGHITILSSDDSENIVSATKHPNKTIRVFSKQIIDFYPSTTAAGCDGNHPVNIRMPVDTPELKVGRLLSDPFGANGVEINWFIAKSIDVLKFTTIGDHDKELIGFVVICTLLAIWYTQSAIQIGYVQNAQKDERNQRSSKRDDVDLDGDISTVTKKLKDLRFELEHLVEGASSEIWGLYLQQYAMDNNNNDVHHGVITATAAKEFMAKESNKHIESENDDHLTMLLCALEMQQEWVAFRVLSFITSSRYNGFITFCLIGHCFCSLNIPETPVVLQETDIDWLTLTFICSFIIIEIIDCILQTIARYIEFGRIDRNNLVKLTKLKYGFKHKYVKKVHKSSVLWMMIRGPNHSKMFLLQLVLVSLVVVNIYMMSKHKIGIFEYYIPIMPVLLAVRSRGIRRFSYQFFYAVYLAKDVLVSYGFLITIVAIFGQAIFCGILNPDSSTDTFTSTTRSWITSFVFVSTGENYNDVVYHALGKGDESESPNLQSVLGNGQIASGNLFFFLIVSVIGLYFFIPIIIRKFELAFDHSRDSRRDKTMKAKINALIAAFIMLDMNDDGSIDVNEFQYLVHASIVSRDAFVDADEDFHDDITLYEFVTTLININDHATLSDKAIHGEECNNTQYQAYLECNWFRTEHNRLYTLVFILIPSCVISLVRGLSGVNTIFTSVMIGLFFTLNLIDINLRCYAFGLKRYSSLNQYRNPAFVEEAILNWRMMSNLDQEEHQIGSQDIVKLTYLEKRWVARELKPTRAMTKWQKKTMSLVHRFELYVIWFGFVGFSLGFVFPSYFSGYKFLFLQIYLLRLFTLIQSNQKLVVLIFTIVPRFLNLLAFVMIFIFIWARIGCTIFAKQKDIVPSEIFETGANASFDTYGTSILTLLQLMVGEGWHEIMYIYMLATSVSYSSYFIFYIIFVTLIISNIFIGLFLSEMEELEHQQSDDQLLSDYQSNRYNFNDIATKRKKILNNKLNRLKNTVKQTEKQITRINQLLLKNKKKKQNKHKKTMSMSNVTY